MNDIILDANWKLKLTHSHMEDGILLATNVKSEWSLSNLLEEKGSSKKTKPSVLLRLRRQVQSRRWGRCRPRLF